MAPRGPDRRQLLGGIAALGLPAPVLAARVPHILWRNGWATLNIGDIGHVPGALALLRRHIPEARVTLWANSDLVIRDGQMRDAGFAAPVDAGSVSRKVMPGLTIVTGTLDDAGRATNPALDAAVASADIMVTGSGASPNDPRGIVRFHRRTGKPVGFFGVTIDPFNFTDLARGPQSDTAAALDAARFVFTRDTPSLRVLAGEDIEDTRDDPATPVDETITRRAITQDFRRTPRGFVPDTAFAFAARDDAGAAAFMAMHDLHAGRFAVFVPKPRWSPWSTPTPHGDDRRVYNDIYLDADHAKLRVAIVDYVRATGDRVALVSETIHGLKLLRPYLYDPLPADVKARVAVLDTFWLPDMAFSLFGRARAVVSLENHSPILAAAAGTPFVMLHHPEDTIKGAMFGDIGLGDWYVPDIGTATGADVSRILMGIVRDPAAARVKLAGAMRFVAERHRAGMMTIRRTIGLDG